ncbi:MAG TPA: helix-turn-helix domain-containing protein [Ramlibacter sp.]|nr:helix-turn-helix domain-containing protein [Ramlibacter sp.]
MDNKGFDSDGFHKALAATVAARNTSWKQVSAETGVSASTLSRMAVGRQPDAASLTALAAWAGLNPTDFTSAPKRPTEPMAMMVKLLREDPNLDSAAAESLEAIFKTAYMRLRKG